MFTWAAGSSPLSCASIQLWLRHSYETAFWRNTYFRCIFRSDFPASKENFSKRIAIMKKSEVVAFCLKYIYTSIQYFKFLNKISELRICRATWNRFPIQKVCCLIRLHRLCRLFTWEYFRCIFFLLWNLCRIKTAFNIKTSISNFLEIQRVLFFSACM